MRKLRFLYLIIALCSTAVLAQTPQGIKYQAVARNSAGEI